jgi:anion-transporting  ArsA/GET3 family ATPase
VTKPLDPTAFFTASRVHMVAGKGGVGKTTITAALALAASRLGLSVLIVEIEGKAGLTSMFGRPPLGYDDVELVTPDGALADGRRAGRVRARSLTADGALLEYLADHGLARVARRMIDTGVVEVVTRGAPGMKDILLLGKIKQLERAGEADVILVDTPASGHAVTFLRSPRGLLDAVRIGPINHQAHSVLNMLTDPARCQVLLVTLAEETPVNETIETAFSLEDDVGVKLGPIVVNGLLPPVDLPDDVAVAAAAVGAHPTAALRDALASAARFRLDRAAMQTAQVARLSAGLPLPLLRVAHRFGTGLGPDDLRSMADELGEGLAGSVVGS